MLELIILVITLGIAFVGIVIKIIWDLKKYPQISIRDEKPLSIGYFFGLKKH